ncbi:hypothetical protein M4578_21430, partial [Salipiger sp. P9]|uniref:hypothetical protein n=1 Tax=Salipiger pentaromativorans TaxID=2943193 RepID=UPI00215786E0
AQNRSLYAKSKPDCMEIGTAKTVDQTFPKDEGVFKMDVFLDGIAVRFYRGIGEETQYVGTLALFQK